MSRYRVYELAKDFKTDSKEVLRVLQENRFKVKNIYSAIGEKEWECFKRFKEGNNPPKPDIKTCWHKVMLTDLPTTEADPDVTFVYEYNGYCHERGITIVPLGDGVYAGDILKGSRVTGEWHIMPKRSVYIKSFLRVNEAGQCKRYTEKGHEICRKISRAVSIWIALTKRYGSTLRQKY